MNLAERRAHGQRQLESVRAWIESGREGTPRQIGAELGMYRQQVQTQLQRLEELGIAKRLREVPTQSASGRGCPGSNVWGLVRPDERIKAVTAHALRARNPLEAVWHGAQA